MCSAFIGLVWGNMLLFRCVIANMLFFYEYKGCSCIRSTCFIYDFSAFEARQHKFYGSVVVSLELFSASFNLDFIAFWCPYYKLLLKYLLGSVIELRLMLRIITIETNILLNSMRYQCFLSIKLLQFYK